MPEKGLSIALVDAFDEAIGEVGMSSGSEAASIAVSSLRRIAGPAIFPSFYRADTDRLWLVAQAGYTGVYDGLGLDRGVMARAATTGATQFVPDASKVSDFLHAQPGFVSEVTCIEDGVLFNIETTLHLESVVVEPAERFTKMVAERIVADSSLLRVGTVARALPPMVALDDPKMIAEYAARIVATHLDLDLCQVILFDETRPPITAKWRHPDTGTEGLEVADLIQVVTQKRAYASWFGPGQDLGESWAGVKDAVVVPINRRGDLIGGLVGAGGPIPSNDSLPESLMAIASHTASCLERVELERNLKRSLTGRSRFMAVVSHELRTPLTAIAGFTDVILTDDTLEDAERREFVAEIREGSRHMLALINDILEVARAEAGQLEVGSEEVQIDRVVSEAHRQVESFAAAKHPKVNIDIPAGLTVLGDELRVRQIIVNLLSNALKFTQGGMVDVVACQDGPTVVIRVTDRGIGIDPEIMETLFEPFTGHSVTVPGSGNGLGLVISRQLARAMGGDLELHSDGVGRGAVAVLTLPTT